MFTATVLVSPNVTVCGSAGTGCSRARSCSSMSAGTRFVVRCTRPFTIVMNARQAASRSANESYSVGEIGVGGHDVGLRQLHGVLDAALAGRVPDLAGVDRDAVEPGERHDLLVPHRDPRDMLDRSRTSRCRSAHTSGRRPAAGTRCPGRRTPSGWCGPATRSRSGTGTTPTTRRTAPSWRPSMTGPSPKSYCNHNPGSVTHGRCTRAFPSRYCFLTCGDRPPGRPLRPGEPHRHQLVVRDVGADLALGLLDPFLDLGQELIDQPRPAHPRRGTAGVPLGDQPGDRVMRTPRQVRGGTQRTGQIERLQNFHRFLGRLQVVPPGGSSGASAPPSGPQEGPQPRDAAGTDTGVSDQPPNDQVGSFVATSGQKPWPSAGSFVAAYGQFFMAVPAGFSSGRSENRASTSNEMGI